MGNGGANGFANAGNMARPDPRDFMDCSDPRFSGNDSTRRESLSPAGYRAVSHNDCRPIVPSKPEQRRLLSEIKRLFHR